VAVADVRRVVGTTVVALAMIISPGVTPGASVAEAAQPAPAIGPTAPAPVRNMAADESAAVRAVDGFWRRHFPQYFHRGYTSPRVTGPYHGSKGPSCDGERTLAFNAFYCKPQDFLAWDDNLMSAGYQKIGDAWVYLIIAHEWGHAIQARLSKRWVSVAAELQADCLAGATLHGAQREGLLRADPGDDGEITRGLGAVADDYAWTASGDHGNAQQRVHAYQAGSQDGVAACFRTGQ
jgi:hypothetical protein